MVEKSNFSSVSYTLGIASIVFGFFSPFAGLIFGIIGYRLSGKQKTEMAMKAKTYNKIGIVISIIVAIIMVYLYYKNYAALV